MTGAAVGWARVALRAPGARFPERLVPVAIDVNGEQPSALPLVAASEFAGDRPVAS
jgi:hypothetical protein